MALQKDGRDPANGNEKTDESVPEQAKQQVKTPLKEGEDGQLELNIFKKEEADKKDMIEPTALDEGKTEPADAETPREEHATVIENWSPDKIEVVPGHARRSIGNIDKLTSSLSAIGQQDEIKVARLPDGRLVCYDGGRRLVAINRLKLDTVKCAIRDMTEEEAVRLSFVINEQRRSLSFLDKLHHIKREVDKGYTLRQLEIKLGYGTYASLSNYMKLDELPEPILNKIDSEILTKADGRVLLRLPDAESQENMAKRIVDEELSAGQADQQITKLLNHDEQDDTPTDNIPTEYPGIVRRKKAEASEQANGSMDTVFSFLPLQRVKTETKGAFLLSMQPLLEVIADARKKQRDGGLFGVLFPDMFSGRDSGVKRLIGNIIHPVLTNRGYALKDRIIIHIIDKNALEGHYQKLTSVKHSHYPIHGTLLDLHAYAKKGDRNPPAEVIAKKSRPSNEELMVGTCSYWPFDLAEHGDIERVRLAIARRFISLYSNINDSIFDPFGTNLAVVQAALELDRVPTCYIYEQDYNPEALKKIYNTDGKHVPKSDWATLVNNQSNTIEKLPETSNESSITPSDSPGEHEETVEEIEPITQPPVQDTPSAGSSAPA